MGFSWNRRRFLTAAAVLGAGGLGLALRPSDRGASHARYYVELSQALDKGKPMPVAAAARFYDQHDGSGFDPSRQLQWLIDSNQRLAQYQQLARQLNMPMRINLEIDVGLHRGGLGSVEELAEVVRVIEADSLLTFSGFMGYEPASVMAWLNPNRERAFFIYGGYWKAVPESPAGLSVNPIYGHSTNQEMLNGSASIDLRQDDWVFLRPTQSEHVFLQFGDIAVYDNGEIIDRWPVFTQGA